MFLGPELNHGDSFTGLCREGFDLILCPESCADDRQLWDARSPQRRVRIDRNEMSSRLNQLLVESSTFHRRSDIEDQFTQILLLMLFSLDQTLAGGLHTTRTTTLPCGFAINFKLYAPSPFVRFCIRHLSCVCTALVP